MLPMYTDPWVEVSVLSVLKTLRFKNVYCSVQWFGLLLSLINNVVSLYNLTLINQFLKPLCWGFLYLSILRRCYNKLRTHFDLNLFLDFFLLTCWDIFDEKVRTSGPQTWVEVSVVAPLPRCCLGSLHATPSTHVLPSQRASVSIIGREPWQGTLLSQRGKEAKHGLVRNVREQPCSFVHSPAGLPAFHSTIQTSESLDKGRLCPPICWLHPALLLPLPPILPFSPSCCASSASLFSLTGTCPRIAQQVPSENRAGDVGRVTLSLFYHLSFFDRISVVPESN